jgi:predicted nucleotidyltransferase
MAFVHPNVQAIIEVAERLGELCDEVAFLGGATVSLLVTEPGAHKIRATRDVDCVVEVASVAAYHRLDERLRARGFVNAPGAVICRYEAGGRVLDIMPTDESILGFANRWATAALRTAEWFALREDLAIRLVSPVMLFVTKLEAFLGRGPQSGPQTVTPSGPAEPRAAAGTHRCGSNRCGRRR